MKRLLFTLAVMVCLTSRGQDSVRVHSDTIRGEQLLSRPSREADDRALLHLLGQADRGRQDSIDAATREADRTDVLTHHLGQTDSANIAYRLMRHGHTTPLATDFLIFMPQDFSTNFRTYREQQQPPALTVRTKPRPLLPPGEEGVWQLRNEVRRLISTEHPELYTTTFMDLPDVSDLLDIRRINTRSNSELGIKVDPLKAQTVRTQKVQSPYWIRKANGLAQFSQNYISRNWYKGGNSNVAILGILTGSNNYDNKHGLQWSSEGEWRMGFNSVNGDTLRKISTNDDLLRLSSKLTYKATRNEKLNYAATFDFQTTLFRTWSGINSTKLKTSFFSPFRLNFGVGVDYKPVKNLSIVASPIAYKFIFVSDTARIDQTAYGIESDSRTLSEVGSSVKATYTWKPIKELQVDSRLYFYTNYHGVELEWEVVSEFAINRYLSTRISFYPRYDSTVRKTSDEKVRMQLKELISVGFSHRFR